MKCNALHNEFPGNMHLETQNAMFWHLKLLPRFVENDPDQVKMYS